MNGFEQERFEAETDRAERLQERLEIARSELQEARHEITQLQTDLAKERAAGVALRSQIARLLSDHAVEPDHHA